MKILIFLPFLIPISINAQIQTLQGSTGGNASRVIINSNFTYLDGLKVEYSASSSNPSANCTAGKAVHLNTTSQELFFCSATNSWTQLQRVLIVKDENGSALTTSRTLNCTGSGIACSYNAGTAQIDITVSQGGAETVASASTITISSASKLVTITGTTTIATINTCNAGRSGDRVSLLFQQGLTVTDGSNLKLAGSFSATSDDTLTLICDGSNWHEIFRSVN